MTVRETAREIRTGNTEIETGSAMPFVEAKRTAQGPTRNGTSIENAIEMGIVTAIEVAQQKPARGTKLVAHENLPHEEAHRARAQTESQSPLASEGTSESVTRVPKRVKPVAANLTFPRLRRPRLLHHHQTIQKVADGVVVVEATTAIEIVKGTGTGTEIANENENGIESAEMGVVDVEAMAVLVALATAMGEALGPGNAEDPPAATWMTDLTLPAPQGMEVKIRDPDVVIDQFCLCLKCLTVLHL